MKRGAALCVLAVLGAVLAGSTPASAALPDARALERHGLRVTWPVRSTSATVRPGTVLQVVVRPVRVRPKHRRSARVSLARVTGSGKVLAVLARRTLRSGRIAVPLSTTPGSRYVLSLDLGRRRYQSRIRIAGAVTTAPPTPAGPGGSDTGSSGGAPTATLSCSTPTVGAVAAQMAFAQASAAPGSSVAYFLKDTGQTCITTGEAYRWEHLDGPIWTAYTPSDPLIFPAIAYTLTPGEVRMFRAYVNPDMPAGHYRIVKDVFREVGPLAPPPIQVYAELDVVAPPPGAPPLP